MKKGVSLTKPYDRKSASANFALKKGFELPFDKYDRVNGLTIVSSSQHANIFEKVKDFDRGNAQDRTLAFQQALLECQFKISRALWNKGVNLNFVNGQGERAVNLALIGLSDYYERSSSQLSAENCHTIWKSLVLAFECVTETRDFNLKNPRDKADFSRFVFNMAKALGSGQLKNAQGYEKCIKDVFKSILTHLIEKNQLNHNTLLTIPTGNCATLYNILHIFDRDLANDIKALGASIDASHSQAKVYTQPGLFTPKPFLEKASSKSMEETKSSPKVRFNPKLSFDR